MTIRMADSVDVNHLPDGMDAYAGYTSGTWPTYNAMVARFPHAFHLSIAINAGQRADCLDIEPGDATVADAPDWFHLWSPGHTPKPVFYTSASNAANLIGVLGANGILRERFLVWSAHYTNVSHICAPNVCGYPAADGTQWADHGPWDESLLADYFFNQEDDVPLTPADIAAVTTAVQNMLRVEFSGPGHELHDRIVQACRQAVVAIPEPPEPAGT